MKLGKLLGAALYLYIMQSKFSSFSSKYLLKPLFFKILYGCNSLFKCDHIRTLKQGWYSSPSTLLKDSSTEGVMGIQVIVTSSAELVGTRCQYAQVPVNNNITGNVCQGDGGAAPACSHLTVGMTAVLIVSQEVRMVSVSSLFDAFRD